MWVLLPKSGERSSKGSWGSGQSKGFSAKTLKSLEQSLDADNFFGICSSLSNLCWFNRCHVGSRSTLTAPGWVWRISVFTWYSDFLAINCNCNHRRAKSFGTFNKALAGVTVIIASNSFTCIKPSKLSVQFDNQREGLGKVACKTFQWTASCNPLQYTCHNTARNCASPLN